MNAEYFVDSNILVYAVDETPKRAAKRARALEVLQGALFGTSGQVLQEFYVVATRKIDQPLDIARALALMERLRWHPFVDIDFGIVMEGARNAAKYQLSYWDGAIIAAAEALQAPILYTEDLNHFQRYGTVTAINPFREIESS